MTNFTLQTSMQWKNTAKLLAAGLCLSLGACDNTPIVKTAPFDKSVAMTLAPDNATLAEIYERSCKACHSLPETGAPLTGDKQTWAPRIAQGMDTLIEHVVNGSEGMPPLGMCMDCDLEQFEALIKFMAVIE